MSGKETLSIAVAGGGSWGTALAHMLAARGHRTVLWARDAAVVESVNTRHENTRYLRGYALHPDLAAVSDPSLFAEQDAVLTAVPCRSMRGFLRDSAAHFRKDQIFINASKGFELDSLLPMSRLLDEALRPLAPRYVVLSGPSFAAGVLEGQPTAVVLASGEEELARRLCRAFSGPNFRCYSSTDVRGVELGGAVKNVMAIAAGLCDGLGLGHNARAALITRGLAEMRRLGSALGARPETFTGLSGLGDLVLTCTGDLSRNRRVGLALAEGRALDDILSALGSTAEGVQTTFAVRGLARAHGVDVPITEAVHAILKADKSARQAIRELMLRELKEETL